MLEWYGMFTAENAETAEKNLYLLSSQASEGSAVSLAYLMGAPANGA